MAHWAKPGVKVVCVNADPTAAPTTRFKYSPNMDGIRARAVYTIREVVLDELEDIPTLLLEEISRPWQGPRRTREHGFWIGRFRPIVTRTQEDDVALFAPILTTREREST